MDFRDITYLSSGTERQRTAGKALRELGLFEKLAAYHPVLVGTIPLGIDHPASDLDILCQVEDLQAFSTLAAGLFGGAAGFTTRSKLIHDVPTVIIRFRWQDFPVEIFAQNVQVEKQNGYRHLLVEQRLLTAGGAPLREAVRRMKQAGYKTEPAFASYLGLEGDPYQALLTLESLDDEDLLRLVKRRMLCGLCEN